MHLGAAVGNIASGGRALDGLGVLPGFQTQPNSECHLPYPTSESAGTKIRRQIGKQPRSSAKVPKIS